MLAFSEAPDLTPAVMNLNDYPGAIVTTYGDIGIIVLVVGIACLVGGFYIGKMAKKTN